MLKVSFSEILGKIVSSPYTHFMLCLSVYLSVNLSIFTSVCLSIYMSVCLSVCVHNVSNIAIFDRCRTFQIYTTFLPSRTHILSLSLTHTHIHIFTQPTKLLTHVHTHKFTYILICLRAILVIRVENIRHNKILTSNSTFKSNFHLFYFNFYHIKR